MTQEPVLLTTSDGLALPGIFETPDTAADGFIDAVLLNPHVSGSYYNGEQPAFRSALAAAGYPVLSISTRGHDLVWRDVPSGRYFGSAYERIEECRLDFEAGLRWLAERGYTRIALIGHSLGGTKSLFYAAHDPSPLMAAVVSLSSPRWSASAYLHSPDAERFQRNLDRAQQAVDAGHGARLIEIDFPIGPTLFSAQGYLTKYGAETYSIVEWCDRIQVPLFRIDGELEQWIAISGLGDELVRYAVHSPHRATVIIPGGDHWYTGVMDAATSAVTNWLHSLPKTTA